MSDLQQWMPMSAMRHLENHYNIPGSAVAFSSALKIYNFYDKILPIKEIETFLSKQNVHTLHRQNCKIACTCQSL